jgi:hypothetical protein
MRFDMRAEVFLGVGLFLLSLGGCSPATTPAPEPPTATAASSAPVPAPVGEPKEQVASEPPSTEAPPSVEVVGIYEQLNVAKRAEAAPHYVGRAVLRQKDGRSIMLETHRRGVRAAEEIAAFEGKLVKVKAARSQDGCLGWGDGNQAAIVGRCVRGIVEISPLVDE